MTRSTNTEVQTQIFAIFTGKHLKAYKFIKKRLQLSCFPVNIAKLLRSHLSWVFLKVAVYNPITIFWAVTFSTY